MRIHHLNCGTFCPLGGAFFDGFSRGLTGRLVCHCLLVETEQGLVLVDTGLGTRDIERPYPRLSRFFMNLNNIQLDPKLTALAQLRRLGFAPEDVRHIVLTHLDFDHAGGIEDFPKATVHVMRAEAEAATHDRDGFIGRRRYRPKQWDHVARWKVYDTQGEEWFGLDCVREIPGLPPEILLVPLVGHTWGHAGVAVRSNGRWFLNAGDAYFFRGEIRGDKYRCPPGLRAYQKLMEVDREARLRNQARLRELSEEHGGEVHMFCGHDAVEFEIMSGRRLEEPAPGIGAFAADPAYAGRKPERR